MNTPMFWVNKELSMAFMPQEKSWVVFMARTDWEETHSWTASSMDVSPEEPLLKNCLLKAAKEDWALLPVN